jgi:copper chaperone
MQIRVEGMTCDGCVRSVTKALHKVDPDLQVNVDLRAGLVELSGAITAEQARMAIERAGFRFVSTSNS